MDGDHLADLDAGFLDSLTPDHLLGRLAALDPSGHDFPGPGMASGGIGAGAELPDQQHLVAHRVVGQDARRHAGLEDLPADHLALAALEQRVPEEIGADAEVTLEGHGALDQLDLFV